MKILSRLLLLVALIAAGVWLWTILFPSPEQVIRKRLAQAASEASFQSGENPIISAARAENLAGRFGTNVEININVPEFGRQEFVGRAEIAQAAAGVRLRLSSLKVEFPDVSVTVAPDKQSAVADVAMQVQAAGEKDFNVQEMKFTFQKIGGDWLITRVETVRAPS
jgi:protein involved in polysaccharide export with SLBB domain